MGEMIIMITRLAERRNDMPRICIGNFKGPKGEKGDPGEGKKGPAGPQGDIFSLSNRRWTRPRICTR